MITLMDKCWCDFGRIMELLRNPCQNAIEKVKFSAFTNNRKLIFKNFKNATVLVENGEILINLNQEQIIQNARGCYLNSELSPAFICKDLWFSYLFSPYLLWALLFEKVENGDKSDFSCVYLLSQEESGWRKIPQSSKFESDTIIGFSNKNKILSGIYKPGGFLFWTIFELRGEFFEPLGYLARHPFKSKKFFEFYLTDVEQ